MVTSGQHKVLIHSSYQGLKGSQKVGHQVAQILQGHGYKVMLSSTVPQAEFLSAFNGHTVTFSNTYGNNFRQNGRSILSGTNIVSVFHDFVNTHKRISQLDIHTVHILNARGLLDVGLLAWLTGKTIVWHQQSGLQNKLLGIFGLLLSKRVIVVSDGVKATFSFAPEALRRKIKRLYNGVPMPKSLNAEEPTSDLVFVGSVVPQKGLHVLIKAAARLVENKEIKVYGTWTNSWYTHYCEALAKKLEVVIHKMGFVSDLNHIFGSRPIVIIPSIENEHISYNGIGHNISWKEGFNLVAVEAASYGCDVVASNSYGLKETAINALRFEAGNVEGLANHLVSLMGKTQNERKNRINTNFRYVKETFSEAKFAETLVRIYSEI